MSNDDIAMLVALCRDVCSGSVGKITWLLEDLGSMEPNDKKRLWGKLDSDTKQAIKSAKQSC
jgi:hypothetical protein